MLNVGDRVTYVGDTFRYLKGDYGTIVEVDARGGDYGVVFDSRSSEQFDVYANSIELVGGSETVNTASDEVKVLEEALSLVYGDRGVAYGHPAVDYERTAKLWGAILDIEMTAVQAIQCMIAMKLSRLCNTPDHRDSWVDVGGYAECGWRTVRYQRGELDS
jgi:hypothetical protein